jgi:type II secretory pathway pseudopilin PulG
MGRVAAWLHLWTPPRGAVVPPAPWRKIGIGAAVLVVLIGVAAAILIPRANRHAAATRDREARADAARHAAFLAQVARTETPHLGTGDMAAAKTQIAAAAKGRKIIGVDCEVFPRQVGKVVIKPKMTYDCTAVTARFDQPGKKQKGIIGVPFRLAIDTDARRFAFCQIVPLGDRDRLSHPLPAACLRP